VTKSAPPTGVSVMTITPSAPLNAPVPPLTGCQHDPQTSASPLNFAQYLNVKSSVPEGSPAHEPSRARSRQPLKCSVPFALYSGDLASSLKPVIVQSPMRPPLTL